MAKRSVPATNVNIQHAITHIEQQRGGGGTELLPALKRALALPQNEVCSRTIVIATDEFEKGITPITVKRGKERL